MDTLLEPADEFNSNIKKLARIYAFKKKGTFDEEKAYRNNKRIALLIASDPLWLIDNCGPFFLKYAEIIQSGDWETLLEQDFIEEKKRYKCSEDGSKHTYDAMDSKIQFIKKMFAAADGEERDDIGDTIKSLLSSYCEYALAVKNKYSVA
jgi:hypothetical protein